MSSVVLRREQYVPKHRASAGEPVRTKAIPGSVLFAGVAVVATGLAVSSGIVAGSESPSEATTASLASAEPSRQVHQPDRQPDRRRAATMASELSTRAVRASRTERRTTMQAVKKRAPGPKAQPVSSKDPRAVARTMLGDFGFGSEQFTCLDALYTSESGWDVHADNPSSSAYGIPQALPGAKMASAGPGWANDAATQIRWGLGYIRSSYGTPCGAWSFKQGNGWY